MSIPPGWEQWLQAQQYDDIDRLSRSLQETGLTGRRLAVQANYTRTEDLLAQMLDHAKVQYEWFFTGLLEFWIAEATAAEPCSKRIALSTDPRVAGIMERVACLTIGKQRSALQEAAAMAALMPPAGKRAARTRFTRIMEGLMLQGEADGREKAEEAERARWAAELFRLFVKIDAPVLQDIQNCMNPEKARASLAGNTRPGTMRTYFKTYVAFLDWLERAKNKTRPSEVADILDYLHVREDEPGQPSVPGSIQQALTWMERRGQLTPFLMDKQIVKLAAERVVEVVSRQKGPTRRAPRFYVAMLEAFENYVIDETRPSYLRVVAWTKLLKTWGTLRYDCVQHLKPHEIQLYPGGGGYKLSAVLMRSKTTGASRRIKELPVHVSQHSFVTRPEWLLVGFRLLQEIAPFQRDYLLPKGSWPQGMGTIPKMASYSDAAAATSRLLADLPGSELGVPMLAEETVDFWSEHSERSVLPSALAILGEEKSRRDMLGRWRPEGSDVYMRTFNATVASMQKKFAKVASAEERYDALDECEITAELMMWLVKRKGLEEDIAVELVKKTEENMRVAPAADRVDNPEPAIHANTEPEVIASDSASSGGEAEAGSTMQKGKLAEPREPGFLLVFSRQRKRAKLHIARGCWIARDKILQDCTWSREAPGETEYDSLCLLCWPKSSEAASDPESSDEEPVDEAAESPPLSWEQPGSAVEPGEFFGDEYPQAGEETHG
jgi:hypothetical protein